MDGVLFDHDRAGPRDRHGMFAELYAGRHEDPLANLFVTTVPDPVFQILPQNRHIVANHVVRVLKQRQFGFRRPQGSAQSLAAMARDVSGDHGCGGSGWSRSHQGCRNSLGRLDDQRPVRCHERFQAQKGRHRRHETGVDKQRRIARDKRFGGQYRMIGVLDFPQVGTHDSEQRALEESQPVDQAVSATGDGIRRSGQHDGIQLLYQPILEEDNVRVHELPLRPRVSLLGVLPATDAKYLATASRNGQS